MSAETDELDRDAAALMAHDLRGVASALSLRAAVLANILSPSDREAFKSLSAELLELDIAMQVSRHPRTRHAAGQEIRISGERWWHAASRLASTALPRKSRQNATIGDAELTLREASILTHVWQAACKDLADAASGSAVQIELRLIPCAGVAGVELWARVADNASDSGGPISMRDSKVVASRWYRYAKRRAKEDRATLVWWHQTDIGLVWSCKL